MLGLTFAGLQRVGLAALLTLPFLVVVLVLSPVLVIGLSSTKHEKRKEARALLRMLIDWSKVIAGSAPQPSAQIGTSRPKSVPRASGQ